MCVCKHTNRMRQKSVIKIFFFQVHTAHNYFDDSFCDTIKIEPFSKEQPFACPILMRMRILRIYFGSHSPPIEFWRSCVNIYCQPIGKKEKKTFGEQCDLILCAIGKVFMLTISSCYELQMAIKQPSTISVISSSSVLSFEYFEIQFLFMRIFPYQCIFIVRALWLLISSPIELLLFSFNTPAFEIEFTHWWG